MTLFDIMQLPIMSNFELIAGKEGLQRTIKEVNILDYEYTDISPDTSKADGLFHSGAMVLASLFYARNDPSKILPVFQQLLADGCCAIAVKTVYYTFLPKEALDFAEQHDFPVFIFSNVDMENIIYDIYAALHQQHTLFSLENKITEIIDGDLSLDKKGRMVEDLIGSFPTPYHCEYALFTKPMDNFLYEKLFTELTSKTLTGCLFFPYNRGILIVLSDSSTAALSWRRILPPHTLGIGNSCNKWTEFSYAAVESICAAKYASHHQTSKEYFHNLGIHQMIMPNQHNYWISLFCRQFIDKIIQNDSSQELLNTVISYVQHDMDVSTTAQALILHKNTVRYRIGKAAQLTGFETETLEFRTILYLSIKWYLIFL